MHRSVFLVLALLCTTAQAQFACLPETAVTPTPIATGSTMRDVETDAAEASAWWCPVTVNGATVYRVNTRWVLKKHRTASYDWKGAYARVKASTGLLDAVNRELAANAVTTVAGTQDRYEEELIKHRACLALTTPPYNAPIAPPAANFCGAVPTPPGPQGVTWLTPNSANLKVYTRAAGDKLGPAIPGRLAPANNSCNYNAPRVTLGTSVYFPLSGGPLNELYLCRLVQ